MERKEWNALARKHLKGCKILNANWQTPKVAKEQFGWDQQGLEIILEKDGNYFFLTVMQDDEGNGPGALLFESHKTKIIRKKLPSSKEEKTYKVPLVEETFPVMWD